MKSEKLNKIQNLISQKNIDVCIVNSPENIFYICGFTPNQLTVSRNPNFAALILDSKDEKLLLSTMDYENYSCQYNKIDVELKPYSTWVGLKEKKEIIEKTPAINNSNSCLDVIYEHISKNYDKSNLVIGIELSFITPNYFMELKNLFPKAEFVDISHLFIVSRSVKTEEEIKEFRKITEVCDKALLNMSSHIEIGMSEKDLIKYYREYIFNDGRYLPSGWTMLGFGKNSASLSRPGNKILKEYHSIRFDGGANADFDFYNTDFSRSWLMPKADPLLKKIKPILYSAQRKMIESIKPGLKFNELFNIGYEYVKKEIPNYVRGHLGHSISIGPQTAEYPVINKDNNATIEENMILCIEVPLYIKDLGGFNIEDMIVVNKDSCEVLTHRTPHYLDIEK